LTVARLVVELGAVKLVEPPVVAMVVEVAKGLADSGPRPAARDDVESGWNQAHPTNVESATVRYPVGIGGFRSD
jgi:hypothetical protein